MECFHSRGQHLCKFIGTKESVCIRKEFNSHRTGLGHKHGRRFIVLGHQYGRRDVMWKHSITQYNTISNLILLPLLTCKSAGRRSFMLHESLPTFSPWDIKGGTHSLFIHRKKNCVKLSEHIVQINDGCVTKPRQEGVTTYAILIYLKCKCFGHQSVCHGSLFLFCFSFG